MQSATAAGGNAPVPAVSRSGFGFPCPDRTSPAGSFWLLLSFGKENACSSRDVARNHPGAPTRAWQPHRGHGALGSPQQTNGSITQLTPCSCTSCNLGMSWKTSQKWDSRSLPHRGDPRQPPRHALGAERRAQRERGMVGTTPSATAMGRARAARRCHFCPDTAVPSSPP